MKSAIENGQVKRGFKLRGLENTRIESLSDGVFAIAIGLLLISSSPPTTYNELMAFMRDFVPFAATISILMWIWHEHYLFFIRFGLRDAATIAINTVVLFLVLFYTFPLKFMFRLLLDIYQTLIMGDKAMMNKLFTETISIEDTPTLMVIYGLGAAAIFFVFAWLNKRALNRAISLELSDVEIQLTKNTIIKNLTSGIIPLVSVLIALFNLAGRYTFIVSGMIYISYSFMMPIVSKYGKKKLNEIISQNSDS